MRRSNLALVVCVAVASIMLLVLTIFLVDIVPGGIGSHDRASPTAAATNRDDAIRPGGGLPTPPGESKLRRRMRRRPVEATERNESGSLAGRLRVGASDASETFPVTLERGATGMSGVGQ